MPELEKFEGRSVTGASVRITNAGDGLSDAMELDPELLAHGSTVWFVIRGEVTQVNYRNAGKGSEGELVRVHTVAAREVARVNGAAVSDLLDSEATRIAELRAAEEERRAIEEEERLRAEEEAAGVQRLPTEEERRAAEEASRAAHPTAPAKVRPSP